MRIRILKRMMPRAQIVWVSTVGELREIVAQRIWDLVLLDHDLKHHESGTDAALFLEVDAPIVVWSLNPEGAERMVKILRRRGQLVVGWLPFGTPGLMRYLRDF